MMDRDWNHPSILALGVPRSVSGRNRIVNTPVGFGCLTDTPPTPGWIDSPTSFKILRIRRLGVKTGVEEIFMKKNCRVPALISQLWFLHINRYIVAGIGGALPDFGSVKGHGTSAMASG
jgi:hypothetical protein